MTPTTLQDSAYCELIAWTVRAIAPVSAVQAFRRWHPSDSFAVYFDVRTPGGAVVSCRVDLKPSKITTLRGGKFAAYVIDEVRPVYEAARAWPDCDCGGEGRPFSIIPFVNEVSP